MKKILILIVVLLIITGSSVVGLYYYKYKKPKVILIGLDGASWKFINPLMQNHQLPNFEKVLKNAATGNLKTFKPTKSCILWTSIATGKRKEKHGILDWEDIDVTTKENIQKVQLVTGNYRIAAAVWEILGTKKYTVGVDNWWVTYPAGKVNGFLISDRLRTTILKRSIAEEKDLVYPPELINELKPMIVRPKDVAPISQKYNFVGYSPEKIDTFYSPSDFFKNLYSKIHIYIGQDQMVANWSLHMLKKNQPDYFGIVLRITDVYSHLGWRFIDKAKLERIVPQVTLNSLRSPDPQVKAKANELVKELDGEYAKALLPAYKFADDYIGQILSLIDSNTIIIMVSDHGFSWNGGGYDHNPMPGHTYPEEPPPGIIVIAGKDINPIKIENASLYDICPTILYAFNQPVGKDMDGRPIKNVFKDTLFNKRKEQFIASYGVGPISSKAAPSKAAEEEVREELKSLGYVK